MVWMEVQVLNRSLLTQDHRQLQLCVPSVKSSGDGRIDPCAGLMAAATLHRSRIPAAMSRTLSARAERVPLRAPRSPPTARPHIPGPLRTSPVRPSTNPPPRGGESRLRSLSDRAPGGPIP